jgi:hypothetical protein
MVRPRLQADLPVLHLQWLLAERNQMKQAWPLPRVAGRIEAAAAINQFYSITLPDPGVRTEEVPAAWIEGVTFPDLAVDRLPSWQERDILGWFEAPGPGFFEPLEIWHIRLLRDEFRRRVGRSPRPDRSYLPTWPERARRFGRRVVGAARRRLPV